LVTLGALEGRKPTTRIVPVARVGKFPSTQMGTTKILVFGRVVMGIRARGIDEGADGVAIFQRKPGLLDPPGHKISTV
jgi:hypothetical protein